MFGERPVIKRADAGEYLAAVRGLPFFGGRLESVYRVYRNLPALAQFYLLTGGAAAVLCGGALLWCKKETAAEAASFIKALGVREAVCNLDTLPLLEYDKTELWVMASNGEGEEGPLHALRPEELLSLWSEKQGAARDETLSDLSLRFARGGLSCWGLYEKETLTAALAAETAAGECYLSFVRTADAKQGAGRGGALIKRAAAHYRTLPCYLLCEAEKRGFYEQNGFFTAARQWRYQKKENGGF